MIGCATSCAPSSLSIIKSERIMVRLFVSLIVAGFYSCNDFFQIVCILLCNAYKTEVRNKHGDGNEKAIGLDKRKNNNFARASRFFVHFSAVNQVSASFGVV